MTIDPRTLAAKIITAITSSTKTVTYDMIIDRYSSRVESRGVLDNAIVILHKSKQITVKDIKGVLTYTKRIEPTTTPQPHLTWTRDNYPYPGKNGLPEFVMPFPEWDLSYIFLTPEEFEEYKEAVRGGRVYKRKRYEHANR